MLQDSSKNAPNSVAEWLQTSDKLTEITKRQRKDQALKDFLSLHFNELDTLRNDYFIASIEQQRLVLHTHSAMIASQLRLSQNLILQKLQNDPGWQGEFSKLKILVRPNFYKQTEPAEKLPPLSQSTLSLLAENAASTTDLKLKNAWSRLIKAAKANKE